MKQCVFILGMHRSGTSSLGGVLNLMGYDFGSDLMLGDDGNPKGYFENNIIYNLNKKILRENNSVWDDYHFNIDKIDNIRMLGYVQEAKKIITDEFEFIDRFAIKDPRNCVLFPIWEKACLELNIEIKVILPYRNPIEIAVSLKKRNKFSFEKSLILWCHHFLSAEHVSREYDRIFSSFDDLVNKPLDVIKKIEKFIHIKMNTKQSKKITLFIDENIKHNNIPIDNVSREVPFFIRSIINMIKTKKFEDDKLIKDVRSEFYQCLSLFQHKEIEDIKNELKDISSQQPLLNRQAKLFQLAKRSGLFDNEYYLGNNEDVKNRGMDPFEHFIEYGHNEGRFPNYISEFHGKAMKKISSLQRQVETKKNKLAQYQLTTNQILKEKENQLILKGREMVNLEIDKNNLSNRIEQLNQEVENVNKESIDELNKQLTISAKSIDQLETINIVLKNQLISLEERVHKENQLLISEKDKIIGELEVLIEGLKSQLILVSEEKQAFISEKDEMINRLEIINTDTENRMKEETKKFNFTIKENRNLILRKNKTIKQLKESQKLVVRRLKSKEEEYKILDKRLTDFVHDFIAITESKSWRITEPFRMLKILLKSKE